MFVLYGHLKKKKVSFPKKHQISAERRHSVESEGLFLQSSCVVSQRGGNLQQSSVGQGRGSAGFVPELGGCGAAGTQGLRALGAP